MAEDLFAELQRAGQISRSDYPKIQRVAHYLREREAFARYYSPRMVSLGPIHHGQPHLQLGEQYKCRWALLYVQDNRGRVDQLHGRIVNNIQQLKNLYTEDAIGGFNDEQLTRMFFVDGCSLLQILEHPDILNPGPLNVKVDQLAIVRQDALLLENQLPFRLLQILSDTSDADLLITMDKFLLCHHLSPEKPVAQHEPERAIEMHPPPPPPAHLLDQLRRKVLLEFPPRPQSLISIKTTYRNLKELKAAGIQVRRSRSKCPIHITFSSCCFSGELNLPEIVVDDTIAPTYLNLMAYEVCPDFDNDYEISSYVEVLDSLIDHPDDVKELRRAQVLHNGLGSDEEVANLFNVISADLVANAGIYASLRAEIETHYQQKYKTWLALACNTYFSNPWSIIAFIAAFVALLLTFIQTWFAVFPSHP